MAHAGTTSSSSGQIGLWKALLAAVVIAAIGIGMVIAVPLITSGRATTAPALDNSYNQIETLRGATTLSGVDKSNAAFLNAAAARARAMSGVPADTSYDLLETLRAQRVPFELSVAPGTRLDATSVDRKYQEIQRQARATSFDRKYQELQRRAGNGQLP
jgi:hypothetical protein